MSECLAGVQDDVEIEAEEFISAHPRDMMDMRAFSTLRVRSVGHSRRYIYLGEGLGS